MTLRELPNSNYFRGLLNNGFSREDMLKLLGAMLLTDGTCYFAKDKRVFMNLYGKDKILHDIFVNLMYHSFKTMPSTYMIEAGHKNGVKVTQYNRKIDFFNDLFELSSSFKTSIAHGQTIESYLKEKQPTLNFLQESKKKVQLEGFRLALCTDGCITSWVEKNKILRAGLKIACEHPLLVNQWLNVSKNLKLKMSIIKSRDSWSSKAGIITKSWKEIEKFWNMGSFIPNVKVVGTSPRFKGYNKRDLHYSLLKAKAKIKTVDINNETDIWNIVYRYLRACNWAKDS